LPSTYCTHRQVDTFLITDSLLAASVPKQASDASVPQHQELLVFCCIL
jgi:hypothetical protein